VSRPQVVYSSRPTGADLTVTRYAKLYYWRGECHTLHRWAQILDIHENTLGCRVRCGLEGDGLFRPVIQYHKTKSIPCARRRLRRVIRSRRMFGLGTVHLEVELYYVERGMRKVA
jgi:hypothetical protein